MKKMILIKLNSHVELFCPKHYYWKGNTNKKPWKKFQSVLASSHKPIVLKNTFGAHSSSQSKSLDLRYQNDSLANQCKKLEDGIAYIPFITLSLYFLEVREKTQWCNVGMVDWLNHEIVCDLFDRLENGQLLQRHCWYVFEAVSTERNQSLHTTLQPAVAKWRVRTWISFLPFSLPIRPKNYQWWKTATFC